MIRKLPIEQLPTALAANPNAVVWDVRDASSYYTAHIAQATNMPLDTLQATDVSAIDPSTTIYVLCGGGTKASRACAVLEAYSAQHTYVELEGGTRLATTLGMPMVCA